MSRQFLFNCKLIYSIRSFSKVKGRRREGEGEGGYLKCGLHNYPRDFFWKLLAETFCHYRTFSSDLFLICKLCLNTVCLQAARQWWVTKCRKSFLENSQAITNRVQGKTHPRNNWWLANWIRFNCLLQKLTRIKKSESKLSDGIRWLINLKVSSWKFRFSNRAWNPSNVNRNFETPESTHPVYWVSDQWDSRGKTESGYLIKLNNSMIVNHFCW